MASTLRISPSGPELTYPLADSGKALTVDSSGHVVPRTVGTGTLPVVNHIVYVSRQWGSDSAGDGTSVNPFATIAHAQSTITTASATDVWNIVLFPGTYAGNLQLKAFTRLVGFDSTISDLNGAVILAGSVTLGASFASATAFASISNVTIYGATTLNYLVASSADGEVDFTDCLLAGAVTLDEIATNVTTFRSCTFESTYAQTGGNAYWRDCSNMFSAAMVISGRAGTPTAFKAYGGGWGGTLHADQAGVTDQPVFLELQGFTVAGNVRITASGPLCPTITAPVGATQPNPTLDGSGAVRLSPGMRVKTTITIPIGSTFLVGEVDPVLVPLPASVLGATNIENCQVNVTSIGSNWQTQLVNANIVWSWSVQNTGGNNEILLNPLNLPAPSTTFVTTAVLIANVDITA